MEPESSILKDYALLCRCGTVIPLQPPIVSWTLPYVKNKDVQPPTLFSLYLKPSSLLPSPFPHPPHPPFKGWNITTSSSWSILLKRRKSTSCSLSCEYHRKHSRGIDGNVLHSLTLLSPPSREKKEKEMVHYRRPCDGLFQSCRQQVTRVSHPSSATGREVFDWILDQGYYSERDTSNVMRQVLEAVAYLHSLKIVHRNLKVNGCTDT